MTSFITKTVGHPLSLHRIKSLGIEWVERASKKGSPGPFPNVFVSDFWVGIKIDKTKTNDLSKSIRKEAFLGTKPGLCENSQDNKIAGLCDM
ncbi:hypothetical protein M0804_010666 [Polistes exclamans]|nr:hypothetical protein M0804_010666 [Polistes exclamans]